jgi:hypothetical protein
VQASIDGFAPYLSDYFSSEEISLLTLNRDLENGNHLIEKNKYLAK